MVSVLHMQKFPNDLLQVKWCLQNVWMQKAKSDGARSAYERHQLSLFSLNSWHKNGYYCHYLINLGSKSSEENMGESFAYLKLTYKDVINFYDGIIVMFLLP